MDLLVISLVLFHTLTANPGHMNLICFAGDEPMTSNTMSRPETRRLSLPFLMMYILGAVVLLYRVHQSIHVMAIFDYMSWTLQVHWES